jgi:hypothetical protein
MIEGVDGITFDEAEAGKALALLGEMNQALKGFFREVSQDDYPRKVKVAVKRADYLDEVSSCIDEGPEFLPGWLSKEVAAATYAPKLGFERILKEMDKLRRSMSGTMVVSADKFFKIAQDYYAGVTIAAKRGNAKAQSLLARLDKVRPVGGKARQTPGQQGEGDHPVNT